jgi:hypothetical protein
MKNFRRLRLQLAITAVIAAVFAFGHVMSVNRQAYNVAVFNYAKNPSAENATTLKAQQSINRRIELGMHLGAFVVFFTVLNVGWILFRRMAQPPQEQTEK